MAFDGIVIANLVYELNHTILNTKISKIAQPEKDELLLTCKGPAGQFRLALSANASLPFAYLTPENKTSPLTAPTFCMVLRKHIANGRIASITQPGLERILMFEIEHLDEMGDPQKKRLVMELMGKHSNIIFCREDGVIIDSIKHVSGMVSSVREVLPGKVYTLPSTQEDKTNPLTAGKEEVMARIQKKPVSVSTAIYSSFTGISPLTANEICFRSGTDGDRPLEQLTEDQTRHVANQFALFMEEVRQGSFEPVIVRKGKEPVEFAAKELTLYHDCNIQRFDSISETLWTFYAEKDVYTRIHQKSADLRKIVNNLLERNQKKYQLQMKQLKDTEKRDKYKLYGELIHTYGYGLQEGADRLEAENYYDENRPITVPLDAQLSPAQNAKKYFDRYAKLKRTYDALTELTKSTKAEIDHLESIQTSLEIALSVDDLVQIREELEESGYVKRHKNARKEKIKSQPFHYRSTDGYDIYVGKNNYQNEELTFRLATGNDWWFHAKGIPGSHVIVKSGNDELPDRVFEEAGKLAGYYSKGRQNDKIEIDYLQRKNVKKPNGSAPGFVVYYTNYSLTIHPDISGIELCEK